MLSVLRRRPGSWFRGVCRVKVRSHADLAVCPAWERDETARDALLRTMRVLPDFVTEAEESALVRELEPLLSRMRYQFDHWDDAIHGYRETERSEWGPAVAEAVSRLRATVARGLTDRLHVLDLDADGYIKPHVDAVRFCGDTVSGLCLLSPAVMRLRHCARPHLFADFLLARRCLYVMSGSARYDFTHEVLRNGEAYFRGLPIERTRRISVIARNRPDP